MPLHRQVPRRCAGDSFIALFGAGRCCSDGFPTSALHEQGAARQRGGAAEQAPLSPSTDACLLLVKRDAKQRTAPALSALEKRDAPVARVSSENVAAQRPIALRFANSRGRAGHRGWRMSTYIGPHRARKTEIQNQELVTWSPCFA